MPGNKWLEVAMIRMNHKGTRMDGPVPDDDNLGIVPEVVAHVKQVKSDGMGVVSMKLCGDGTFTQHSDRQGRDALRVQERRGGLRDRWIQEPTGSGRSHRQPKPRAGVVIDAEQAIYIYSAEESCQRWLDVCRVA
jgi:hypothetical protein